MTSPCFVSHFVSSALALVCLLAPTTSAQGHKLSGPLARPIGGDIQGYLVSPDGERIVYLADEETDEVLELFVAKVNGGGRVKLAGPAVAGGSVSAFSMGPRGRRVVLTGDLELDGVHELYSIPIDGGALVKLASPDMGVIGSVQIDPSERHVLYRAGTRALFSVPITGGAAVRLDEGGRVYRSFISPDGHRVVFVSDQGSDRAPALFSVPIAGGSAVRLNAAGTELEDSGVQDPGVRIDPRSTTVVFTAKPIGANPQTWRLYSAPLDGSGPARQLLRRPVAYSFVRLGSQGDRAVCVANSPRGPELVSTPIDGSADVVTLFSLAGLSVRQLEITPDGRFVLFAVSRLGAMELYRVPIDGSAPAVQIAEAERFVISPDSSLVVYDEGNAPFDVATFSARIDLSSPPLRIADGMGNPVVAPDSTRVVYELPTPTFLVELHSVPILGGAPPVRLNGPLPFGGTVQGRPAFAADRVVYRASQAAPNQFELFSTPIDGSQAPVRINGELPIGPVEGDVWDMALSPDGTRVVYRADQETDGVVELFSVRTDRSLQPVKLSVELEPGHQVAKFVITPDGERVVYWIEEVFASSSRLMVVPIEGGASLQLGERIQDHDFLIEATGARIVVVQDVAGSYPDRRILSLALDGGSAPVELAGGSERGVPRLLTPDQRLLHATVAGLSIVPIDGSSSALPLVPFTSFGAVQQLALDTSNTRIVYVGDLLVDQRYELFSAPLDGSVAPVRLTPTLPNSRLVKFQPASDGWVYFQADMRDNGRPELYRVPLDGATPAVRLNPPLVNRGEVSGFVVSVAAGRVVYLANQEADARYELFSVPLAGGEARKISGGLQLGFPFDSYDHPMFALSPDGERIVFRAEGRRLYSAPVEGDSPPIYVSAPTNPGRRIVDFRFGPDEASLLYSAEIDSTGYALFHAPIGAAGRARQITGVGLGRPDQAEPPRFAFAPNSDWIVFQSDQQTRRVHEVFVANLEAKLRRAASR